MEPQINEPEGFIAPLKKVTPLSKYLSMALFITLPFLGGYVGYNLASSKVFKVESDVPNKVLANSVDTTSQNSELLIPEETSEVSNVSVSFQKVMGWITYALADDEWEKGEGIFYTRDVNSIILGDRTIYTHEAGFDPTRVEIEKIDSSLQTVVAGLTNEKTIIESVSINQQDIVKLTKSNEINDCKDLKYIHEISENVTGVVGIATCPTHSEGYDDTKILVAESVVFTLID